MVTEAPTTSGVLVADDDDLVRLVIRRVLERAGHDVHEAATVDAAVDACGSRSYALAIVDAHMPGGDLAITVDGMRRARPEMPILIISGDSAKPTQSDLPRTEFLSKPVEIASLTSAVDRLLGSTP